MKYLDGGIYTAGLHLVLHVPVVAKQREYVSPSPHCRRCPSDHRADPRGQLTSAACLGCSSCMWVLPSFWRCQRRSASSTVSLLLPSSRTHAPRRGGPGFRQKVVFSDWESREVFLAGGLHDHCNFLHFCISFPFIISNH